MKSAELTQFLVVCVLALVISRCTSQTDVCRYTYSQQPPRNLQCNPYTNGRLILDCEVTYSRTEQAVTLQWLFQRSGTTGTSILNNQPGKYTITPGLGSSLTRSQVRIDGVTDSDAGAYSCQVHFTNGTLAMASQELDLFSRGVLQAQGVSQCSNFIGQSTRDITSCAVGEFVGNGVPDDGGSNPGGTGGGGGGGGGGGSDDSLGSGNIIIYALIAGVIVFIVVAVLLVLCVVFGSMWCSSNAR